MKKVFIIIISLLGLVFSDQTQAHSEHDKARFVAPNGEDTGRCDNVLRPCKTITYAINQANKGDKVLVASGRYHISTSEDLFSLKSNTVPIYGGYNRFDHYQSQSPQSNVTTLTNIPHEMAHDMRLKGFSVLADGKGLAKDETFKQKMADYQKLSTSQQNIACVDGKADAFECSNIDLLSHFPLTEMSSNPSDGNDIWGHVDLNDGREYAIMGIYNGTIIVDVTDPTSPTEVGTISGVNSTWRDVKVYQYFDESINLWQAYAYVTTEGSSFGLTDHVSIIDLNNLPNSVSLLTKSTIAGNAHNVYISNVDYSLNIALPDQTPSLQIVGASTYAGAFQSYSLANPTELSSKVSNFGSGYTHDGSSLVIDDDRASSDCGLSTGNCTVFIDFNEKEMKLWNITDPTQAVSLGQGSYDDVSINDQYVHSGWGTEDKQYILVHDEFDEFRGGLNTTVRIFSIENLKNPVQVGQWTGDTKAIDHNGFVRGNRYYMSNYERGLTILDISDPATPVEVGFFDTYTPSNDSRFRGAWGVYPFLPSGNILISDINSGLYVFKDNTKSSPKGKFTFTNRTTETPQDTTLSLTVQRNGSNIDESVSVSYQVIQGSAKAGEDFQLSDNTLTWEANDNSDKTIEMSITSDSTNSELPENFFVRLYKPTNGTTLGENSYNTITIEGVQDAGAGSFTLANETVAENAGTVTVDITRTGSTSGNLSFEYEITANEAETNIDFEEASGVISWADGEEQSQSITINILDDDIDEEAESFTINLVSVDGSRLGTYGSVVLTIADDDNNQAPTVSVNEDFEVNISQLVSLSATAEDVDDDAMTYLWQQTAGDSVELSNSDSLIASFTAPSSASSLTFSFTATDFRGASTVDSVTVTIIAPTVNIPPTSSTSSGGGSTSWMLLIASFCLFRKKYPLNIKHK